MGAIEIAFGDYLISTDKEKIDVFAVYDFLTNHSGWAIGIPLSKVRDSINNSLNFGLFCRDAQIGFARVISDFSTIAYIGDVYILPAHRGKGLSSALMKSIMTYPELQSLRRWILLTSNAHWLYRKYGFSNLSNPGIYMELFNSYTTKT